jgi:hypothetical protein
MSALEIWLEGRTATAAVARGFDAIEAEWDALARVWRKVLSCDRVGCCVRTRFCKRGGWLILCGAASP